MVTRRSLLVGSAAVLSSVGTGTGTTIAAPVDSTRRLASATAQARGAVFGFELPGGLLCPVPYLSRAAWGADESWRFPNGVEDWLAEHHPVQALTVHHTGFAASADPAATVRTIYRQQALTPARGGIQGWGDIGYNLLIDDAGVVYEGRHSGSAFPIFGPAGRLMTTGAHVLYYNTGNIGVCLLGYLNDAPPTQAAQDSLVTVLAYLAAVAGVNPVGVVNYYNPVPRPDGTHSTATVRGVSGHRNWAPTDCPGDALYPLLGQIRQRAADAMPAPPKPTQSSGSSSPTSTASTNPQPGGTTQPTSTASTNPHPGGTTQPTSTASQNPQPGGTNQPTPTPSHKPPQPGTSTPSAGSGGSRSERGGDEYVAVARSASPSQFPTVKPSPTSTVDSAASAFPSSRVTPTWTTPSATPTAGGVDSGGWGLTAAAAVGATVAGALGSLGGWWWRRRRTTSDASNPGGPEPSPVDESTPEPSIVDQPAAEQSTRDEPATASTTAPPSVDEAVTAPPLDEPKPGPSPVDGSTP